ncbi:MAG TPA: anthrax toxin-like adenylyl cyclase domain-containing protein [Candidatus Acidoferrales bacterium]|nr:anthrax toxin-like adenylyl cyclase domain-containing protein [Candidatus Acidoferrales bacterium]
MSTAYLPSSGITFAHFQAFQSVAQRLNRIIVVRNTNTKSTYWIERGYPPKPKVLEALHTDEKTGKVTATSPAEFAAARAAGYYVIDSDGIARRNRGEQLTKRFPFSTPDQNAPGQVIDPARQLSLVGDYDLMGVIDPNAKGRVITLISSNGIPVENRTNPDVDRVINELNAMMREKRVMHGPQDLYKSFRGACAAFLNDGHVEDLNTEQRVRDFYARIGRETIAGSYRRGA